MDRKGMYHGKSIKTNDWVEGNLLTDSSVEIERAYIVCGYVKKMTFLDVQRIYYCTETYEVIPESVGQYTGKKDVDGEEIYEKDIIKWEDEDIQYIEWDKNTSGFCRKRKLNPIIPYALHSDSTEHMKIIGNKTDNPNLLE